MRVLEQFVLGKNPDQGLREDVVAANDDHAAVFDGAGGMGLGPGGTTGARFAASVLAAALADVPRDADFALAATLLSAALDARLRAEVGAVTVQERPYAVAVIYSAAKREVWRVGDPHFAIDGNVELGRLASGEACSAFRAAYLDLLILSGEADERSLIADDPTRDFFVPMLQRRHLLRNSQGDSGWEFGAFDGLPIPPRFLEVQAVPQDASEVVLASDRYPQPSPSLQEAELAVRTLLETDPLCIHSFRAEKGLRAGMHSFDDRAYLRLSV